MKNNFYFLKKCLHLTKVFVNLEVRGKGTEYRMKKVDAKVGMRVRYTSKGEGSYAKARTQQIGVVSGMCAQGLSVDFDNDIKGSSFMFAGWRSWAPIDPIYKEIKDLNKRDKFKFNNTVYTVAKKYQSDESPLRTVCGKEFFYDELKVEYAGKAPKG